MGCFREEGQRPPTTLQKLFFKFTAPKHKQVLKVAGDILKFTALFFRRFLLERTIVMHSQS